MASNFLPAMGDFVRDRVCPVIGSLAYVNESLNRALGPEYTRGPVFPLASSLNRLFCDRPPDPPPPPPFTGGQCNGVVYRLEFSVGFTVDSTGQVVEPVRNGVRNFQGVGPIRPRGAVEGEQFVWRNGGDGQVMGAVGLNGNSAPTYAIYDLIRQDNLPDVCGDPDPDIDPVDPGDVTFEGDVTYNDVNNTTVNIPVVLVFGFLQINAKGEVSIPFKVDVNGEFNLNGQINAQGEVNFGVALPGSNIDTDIRIDNCRDLVRPDDEVPEDPEPDLVPQEPDQSQQKILKGVLVTVNALSNIRASVIAQDENPDIYVPSLGHVNFLCRVGTAQAGWTGDIQVKNRRHLIPCPWEDGAIAVRGTPQPGVTWTLTPIYGYAETPVQYPEPVVNGA